MRIAKQLTMLVLLAAICLGTLYGYGYLFMVAVGAVKGGGQLVAIIAWLTTLGTACSTAGCAAILMRGKQIDRNEGSASS